MKREVENALYRICFGNNEDSHRQMTLLRDFVDRLAPRLNETQAVFIP